MKQNFCMGCMRPYPEGETACPGCGNVHGQEQQNPQALPCGTILNGRYLLGKAVKQDAVCVIYVGMDLTGPAPVTVREFLPSGQASRSGGVIHWAIAPQEAKAMCQSFYTSVSGSGAQAFVANKTVYAITGPETAAPQKAPENVTAAGTVSTGSGKKIAVIAVSAVAAAAIFIGTWCGVNHFSGSKQMANGDYAAAAKAFRRDFLFSRSDFREAARHVAEDAFASGDFETAAEFFRQLGEDGESLWLDSVAEQLAAALLENQSADVDAILEQLPETAQADVLLNRARLIAAEKALEDGRFAEAAAFAEAITNPADADPASLLADIYPQLAKEQLKDGLYAEAMDIYRKLPEDSTAQKNLEILTMLDAGNCLEAAKLAQAAAEAGTTDLPLDTWAAVFDGRMGKIPGNDLNAALAFTAAKAMLRTSDLFTADAFQKVFEVTPMIDKTEFDPDLDISFASRDALFAQCGGKDTGKILIVVETRSYSTKVPVLMPSLRATSLLPAQYVPASLDEVDQVILVSYDYLLDGSFSDQNFTGTTASCREQANVQLFQLPGASVRSISPTVQGPVTPDTMSYTGARPRWFSGGAPNMGQTVFDVISKLIAG